MEPIPVLNKKPIFQKFIEANSELLDCYGNIPKPELDNLTSSQMDSRCAREK